MPSNNKKRSDDLNEHRSALFLQKKNRFDNDYQSGWHAKRDSNPYYPKSFSMLSAILLAVIFAYITNKDLVFHSEADSFKERIIEFCKFMLGRAFTMVVEFVGGLILFELPIPNIITKMGLTIIVIILNFFISKFFAFKSKKDN